MRLPIYLDYAATTPVDPRVAEKMLQGLTQTHYFANPHATHALGRSAAQAVEIARQQVADSIGAHFSEIVWTSGATESNNLAIKSVVDAYHQRGKHLITSSCEHSSVFDVYQQLASQGFEVTYLKPNKNGLFEFEQVSSSLRSDTILVSLMHVNNETGVMQDTQAIANLLREKNIFFHVDAAQSVGKIDFNVEEISGDLISFSAHKAYGPKGVGALYRRQKSMLQLKPQMVGGGQEQGLRSGTVATHQVMGMGEAFAIARSVFSDEIKRIIELNDRLCRGIKKIGGVHFNGDSVSRVPHIVNVSFENVDINQLLPAIKDIAISSGAACHANSSSPSRVLLNMGLSEAQARHALRFSLGRFTTDDEIDYVIEKLKTVINMLRCTYE